MMPSATEVRRAARAVERYYVRTFTRPFDEPFYRDPLFLWGLALSTVGCLVFIVVSAAMGEVHGVKGAFEALVVVLYVPSSLTWLIFGGLGGSVRGARRGWKEP
jgi:hypothetical protein